MVGASGFEPPTSWSRTMKLNSINASSGVAYGAQSAISPLLVVLNLYLDRFRVVAGLGEESRIPLHSSEAYRFRSSAFVHQLPERHSATATLAE
jgi:hypothetical protein